MRDKKYLKLRGKAVERGYKLEEIAKEINITPQALTSKLSGKTAFTLPETTAICAILECSIDVFFDPELHDIQLLMGIQVK